MNMLLSFWHDESGATAIEYGFIIALISASIVVGVQAISAQIVSPFSTAGTAIASR